MEVDKPTAQDRAMQILSEAMDLAVEYRRLTGKPLGVAGEVAEFHAARLLNLTLAEARQAGYDATESCNGTVRRLQIKGRCLQPNCKSLGGQRLGSIRLDKEWDSVLMVLMDENLDAIAIYEAERSAIENALNRPGSVARNERGALPASKFRSIGKLRWKRS